MLFELVDRMVTRSVGTIATTRSRAAFTLLFLFCACFLGPAREAGSYKALPNIELQS